MRLILRKYGTKITAGIKRTIDNALEDDNEHTGAELVKILQGNGSHLSISTVLRCRKKLGWTCNCQLIREGNKVKRMEWALQNVAEAEEGGFSNVIFTDECSVQLEMHRRRACRRIGQLPLP